MLEIHFAAANRRFGVIVDAVAFFCLQMIQTRVVIDCQAQHLVMLRPEDGLVDLQDGAGFVNDISLGHIRRSMHQDRLDKHPYRPVFQYRDSGFSIGEMPVRMMRANDLSRPCREASSKRPVGSVHEVGVIQL